MAVESDQAIEIVRKLAEGVNPYTGERFPADSAYQHADTVRALYLALDGLGKLKRSEQKQKVLPQGAGRPWTPEDEQKLLQRFDAKVDVTAIANEFNRTTGAIWSRLEKLGRVTPRDRGTETRPLRSSRILVPRSAVSSEEPPY